MPKRLCRWGVTLAAGILSLLMVVPAYAALPVEGAAATADYWLRADGDRPLLSAQETAAFTRASTVRGITHELTAAGKSRSGDVLRAQIHAAAQGLDDSLPEL